MKILVWGTGNNAEIFMDDLGDAIKENLIGYIDSNVSIKCFKDKTVYHPCDLKKIAFDAIIVCSIYSQDIFEECVSLKLDMKKIIFLYNSYIDANYNKYKLIENLLGKNTANVLNDKYRITESMNMKENYCMNNFTCKNGPDAYERDYVRKKCFELCAQEIINNNISGSVAEAGVFRGDFSQYINFAFPNRKLYLCDTFESFDKDEASNEIEKGYIDQSFTKVFYNTSIDIVMSKMYFKDNVIIKKGLFPKTMEDVDDIFSFVSLDMDLENSILEGRYENEINHNLFKVPLCDQGGTLIITK